MGSTNNGLVSFKALNGASLAASVAGPATNINNMVNLSAHIKCGAGATGEFFIQGSNVKDSGGLVGNGPGADDWVTIPVYDSSGAAYSMAVTGSATDFLCNLQILSFSYFRVIYTRASGTGTATAWVTGKSI